MDVLTGFDKIKVCTAYKYKNKKIDWFPADIDTLENVEPVYDTLPGWSENLDKCRNLDELPENTKKYIRYIEDYLNLPVKYISNGYRRDQIIQI